MSLITFDSVFNFTWDVATANFQRLPGVECVLRSVITVMKNNVLTGDTKCVGDGAKPIQKKNIDWKIFPQAEIKQLL